jgi:demethylmenaquinone methyltransferase/2-methoxy-6-polyprenyl-1,4-benzoquinol methylase
MFDRIAHRYDLLNRTLSMGQDVVWRNRVARYLPDFSNQHVLDLATGTGDQLISIFEKSDRVKSGVGIDMAEKMLELGRPKLSKRDLDRAIQLQTGNAAEIPFPEDTFHAVTISFGIRNVSDVPKSMREMRRVLKPGGRALILEFSLPGNKILQRWNHFPMGRSFAGCCVRRDLPM